MGLTVREALQLPALKDAVLLAGKAGLDRVITSVNIMEVPHIAKFIKKDEFLLTIAYPIRDDPQAQADLISTLVKQGLAALAIKPVDLWLHEVPPIMIQQAEEASFPLIQLSPDTSFNEIINPILGEILNRQATILLRNEEVHRSLTDIVLTGGGLHEIARMLGTLLQAPVSIHNTNLRLLAYCQPDADKGAAPDENAFSLTQDLAKNTSQLKTLVRGVEGQVQIEWAGQRFEIIVHPVTVARENYACLIVWQGRRPVASTELNIIEQAATVVALEIAKLRAVAEVEKRFRASFIEDLMQDKLQDRADVLSRGELYGWDLSPCFIPLLVEIDDFNQYYLKQKEKRETAKILRGLWDAVATAVALHAPGSIAIDMSHRVLVLYRTPEDRRAHENASELAAKILEEVVRDKKVTVSIGVGRHLEDIMNLKEGYGQASQALEIGRMVQGPGCAMHFDDLGVYRILADDKMRPELERFSRDLLTGLMESDQRTNADLLHTLDVVLQCNGNLRLAARELYVHYNTLRYRVARIQEITMVDLGSSEGRLNLQMALRILRILRKR